MLSNIKMIFYRLYHNKLYFMMALLVTPIVVLGAVFFTNTIESRLDIAVVGVNNVGFQDKNIKITQLEETPKLSELVQGRYDAVVLYKNGEYEVRSTKGEEFKQAIKELLKGNKADYQMAEKRGVVTNLVGFLILFIILFSSMLFKFYYEDKKGMNRRILSSGIGNIRYCLSHCIVVFTILFIPTVVVAILSRIVAGFSTNVNNLELTFIFLVLCIFATAFTFFISSIIKSEENGGVSATMIIVITTLFSGCLFPVTQKGFVPIVSSFLPQKYILDFTMSLEQNISISYVSMIALILISIILISLRYFGK